MNQRCCYNPLAYIFFAKKRQTQRQTETKTEGAGGEGGGQGGGDREEQIEEKSV